MTLAAALSDRLSLATRRGQGIVRDSYGSGEQAAHDIMRAAAETIGLEISTVLETLPKPFAPAGKVTCPHRMTPKKSDYLPLVSYIR